MDTLTDISSGAALNAAHLVKLLQIKRVSRSTISELLELMLMLGIADVTDNILRDILLEYSGELDIAGITKEEIMKGFEKGTVLLEESNRMNIHIISYFDKCYPAMLRTITSSPLIINVLGNYSGSNDISLSLIGTRKPSRYGKRIAEKLAIHLAGHNIHMITGMEAGCNNAAAAACARSGGVLTTVLPTGLDAICKKEYKQLAETVLKNDGCIMSEYMLNSKDLTFILSQRSRLIPALGLATFVVESDIDGETIHLAHIAKGYERKLFAFDHPEHMLNDKSRGNQMLISRGYAVGVKGIEDILS
jgi:DNA processing protein